MSRLLRRAAAATLATCMLGALSFTAPASAGGKPGGGNGNFSCRASLLRIDGKSLLSAVHLEPVVANRDGDPCVSDQAGLLNEEFDLKYPDLRVALKLLWADTYNKDGRKAVAETGVAHLTIEILGQLVEVDILTAEAGAQCKDGTAALGGQTNVLRVRVNKVLIDVPYGQKHVEIPLLDYTGKHVATLHLNEETTGAGFVKEQALVLNSVLADVVVAEAIADVHGNPCSSRPPKPPKQHRGWMTGGGTVGDVSHGMRLECAPADGANNLQVSWGNDGGFHLETVTGSSCTDDPTIDPGNPAATFDTISGSGTGRCRGGGTATATWTRVSDAGEPGDGDWFSVVITGDCNKTVAGYLDGGNHQAHRRF